MNDNRQLTETIIDEALQSYPQAALPPRFLAQVMTQIEALPRVQSERFRLHFLDIVLALCLGSVVTLMLVGILGYFGVVNLSWLPINALQTVSFTDDLSASTQFWLILSVILFAEIGLGAGVCVQLWQDRPYTVA